ncbi:urea ABC transporter substrate-binding protein [Tautonia sociabilis]|nr:urea ABC transporter substrate-binding protein [Tautonia sociabilis]
MKWFWARIAVGVGLLAVLGGLVWWGWSAASARVGGGPIVVGILHSRTGPMAVSERGVIDATVLALEEINQGGGILGREVRWVIADGASDETTFAREAARLIDDEGVSVLFGCWTSASRKAVRPVVEQRDHLLIYPVQYEGCEESPNIVYLGAAPNQQIIPAVAWAMEHLGRSFYLVGSDYIFPRVANTIIRDQVEALGGEIAGEAYLPLGESDVSEVVARIVAAKPAAILNTINGETNAPFFEALSQAAGPGDPIPTISFSVGEPELRQLGLPKSMAGHYAAWNYFESLDRPSNRAFLSAFRARYGPDRSLGDPMEAAYCGVALWARAVAEAGNEHPREVRREMQRQSLDAPEGIVSIDPETQHAWKVVRIGRARPDGQFDVVWTSGRPIRPIPFPLFRSQAEWERLVDDLGRSWGGRWSNPGRSIEFVRAEADREGADAGLATPSAEGAEADQL